MKILAVAAALSMVALAGCNTTGITLSKTQVTVIEPPAALYNCKQIVLPSTDDLTNKQVSQLIVQFYQANRNCHINMLAIKKFVEEAKTMYGSN